MNLNNLRPTSSRVAIRLDPLGDTEIDGGIIIPRLPDRDGDYKPVPRNGLVVSVGPGAKELVAGERVCVDKYDGAVFKDSEGELMLVHEEKVLWKWE